MRRSILTVGSLRGAIIEEWWRDVPKKTHFFKGNLIQILAAQPAVILKQQLGSQRV